MFAFGTESILCKYFDAKSFYDNNGFANIYVLYCIFLEIRFSAMLINKIFLFIWINENVYALAGASKATSQCFFFFCFTLFLFRVQFYDRHSGQNGAFRFMRVYM